MIAWLLAATLQQRDPYRVEVEDPILALQREIILGVSTKSSESLGLYHSFTIGAVSTQGNDNITATFGEIEESVRVGNASWSVKPSVYGSSVGHVIEVDGVRMQKAKVRLSRNQVLENDSRNTMLRRIFVDEKGNLLFEEATAENTLGSFAMSATYGKDSFDLVIRDKSGQRQMTVNPGCGIEAINMMFKPMLKGQDVLLKEKEFYSLNPYTGTPEKYTARVSGKFSGKFSGDLHEGRCVDITGPKGAQKAFISYEGFLMKVEAPNRYYLSIESPPPVKPTLRHRRDGG